MSEERRLFGMTCGAWCAVIGGVFVFVIPIPWLLGNFMILAAGSGETVSVKQRGIVTCPECLKWSGWQKGRGALINDERRFSDQAEILEYRVGTDKRLFARLTFYQAKYRLPDGSSEIGPARGPLPLVGVDTPRAAACSLAAAAISLLCFSALYFWRRGAPPDAMTCELR